MKWAAKGFTIVELIIVVTVIAILAAISIVSFNGIQDRAYNARVTSDAKHWLEAFQLYGSAHGGKMPYAPMPATGLYSLKTCLGGDRSYPVKADSPYMSSGYCAMGSNLTAKADSTFLQPFRDAGTIVDGDEYNRRLTFYFAGTGGINTIRGIWYQYGRDSGGTPNFSQLLYILAGNNADCVLPEASKITGRDGAVSTGTICYIELKDTFQIVSTP